MVPLVVDPWLALAAVRRKGTESPPPPGSVGIAHRRWSPNPNPTSTSSTEAGLRHRRPAEHSAPAGPLAAPRTGPDLAPLSGREQARFGLADPCRRPQRTRVEGRDGGRGVGDAADHRVDSARLAISSIEDEHGIAVMGWGWGMGEEAVGGRFGQRIKGGTENDGSINQSINFVSHGTKSIESCWWW